MNKGIRFTDEFKQDAVAQIVERGYSVSEVAEWLGISTKSLYTWKSQFAKLDLSRFDAAPLIAFTATKETDYGTETDGRIPPRCGAHSADKRANA